MTDVHTEHCCILHGCKYGKDDECAVMTRKAPQAYPCETCQYTGLSVADQIKRDEWLKSMKLHTRKDLTFISADTTLMDVERWLRAALGEHLP